MRKHEYLSYYTGWIAGSTLTFATTGAFGRKHAMIVVDAVDLVIHIDGEGNSIEAFVADAAAKAARMI